MVRTIVYFFFAAIVLGVIAVPGLGAFALLLAPLLGLGLLWRIALTVFTDARPVDAVVHTRRRHLLGPGGPDDSFADSPLGEDEYPAAASPRPSVTRNGRVRDVNAPRPGLSEPLHPALLETLSVRPRGENSIQGGGG